MSVGARSEVSLVEQMALLKSSLEKTYKAEMEVALDRIAQLEQKICTPVSLVSPGLDVRDSQVSGTSTGKIINNQQPTSRTILELGPTWTKPHSCTMWG